MVITWPAEAAPAARASTAACTRRWRVGSNPIHGLRIYDSGPVRPRRCAFIHRRSSGRVCSLLMVLNPARAPELSSGSFATSQGFRRAATGRRIYCAVPA